MEMSESVGRGYNYIFDTNSFNYNFLRRSL